VSGEEDDSARKKIVMQEEVARTLGTLPLHFLSKVVTDIFVSWQITVDVNGRSPNHAGMWINEEEADSWCGRRFHCLGEG
jgi:hypothetical protein